VSLELRLRRWHRLRRIPVLDARSVEGAIVQATGSARSQPNTEPIVPSISTYPCVVAWTKFFVDTKTAVIFERLLIRPFVLETTNMRILVDASHAEFLLPFTHVGRIQEIGIAEGQAVTIVGSVLRDAAAPTNEEVAFRADHHGCKLVGSKTHPILITFAA
jgi:hypothetical protein